METQTLTGRAGAGDLKAIAVVNPDTESLTARHEFSPERATLFKAETGINSDDDLRRSSDPHSKSETLRKGIRVL